MICSFVGRAMSRPSTFFLLNCSQDVDARHCRQVYAVCARQTATAGHNELRDKLLFNWLLFESGSKEAASISGMRRHFALTLARASNGFTRRASGGPCAAPPAPLH